MVNCKIGWYQLDIQYFQEIYKKGIINMQDSILLKNIIFNCIISALLLYASFSFLKGTNAFNNKKIVVHSIAAKMVITKILPVVLLIGAIWFSGEPILDYMVKDYKINKGILRNINAPYRYLTTEEFFVEGERDPYYLPKGLLNIQEKGKTYEFKYAKRSRIILEIHKSK